MEFGEAAIQKALHGTFAPMGAVWSAPAVVALSLCKLVMNDLRLSINGCVEFVLFCLL